MNIKTCQRVVICTIHFTELLVFICAIISIYVSGYYEICQRNVNITC